MEKKLLSEKKLFLESKALKLRINSIKMTTESKSGHPTSCLSAADLVATLFFHTMSYNPSDPKNPNNDRFILSKGHAVPVVYAAWKEVGVINEEELLSLRKFDSPLEGHPTTRFKYNEAATGSLGQGLSIGLGMALNAKLENLSYRTYVMLGDGESAEGEIWEAAEIAPHYKLDNIVGILDCNRWGQSDESIHNHHVERYVKKFEAFGWHSFAIDGHDIDMIAEALTKVQKIKDRPTMIIAKTYKGYGIDAMQDKNGFHGKPLSQEDASKAIDELKSKFSKADKFSGEKFVPSMPDLSNIKPKESFSFTIDLEKDPNKFLFGEGKMATREAYGYALAALGRGSSDIIVLDGDVKNSTYSNIFEKEHGDRFFQCFIAEQNMIGIATGLQSRGKVPFAATFGAFLTRAFDQIRMAGIGRNAIRLCGSHSGVSIGEDGPSQMGLEDLAMMRSVPNSIIFYPSDAVSAYKQVELMANYNDGISYIRTTRGKTPIIYDKNEEFKVGGCKVLKQSDNDKACVIAAGITLHEALSAYDELKKENIDVAVIDLYSIKPLDIETIINVAEKSDGKVITVEDHYLSGGIGETVSSSLAGEKIKGSLLYVDKIPRSATEKELLAYEEIDSASIVKKVKEVIK